MNSVLGFYISQVRGNWQKYFSEAEENRKDNFLSDKLLLIKGIGLKVRNLALSNFSPHFVAVDIHVGRVIDRIGFFRDRINSRKMNLRYLYSFVTALAEETEYQYSETDFDRIFWHFGKIFFSNR